MSWRARFCMLIVAVCLLAVLTVLNLCDSTAKPWLEKEIDYQQYILTMIADSPTLVCTLRTADSIKDTLTLPPGAYHWGDIAVPGDRITPVLSNRRSKIMLTAEQSGALMEMINWWLLKKDTPLPRRLGYDNKPIDSGWLK